jgi:membrane protein
LHYYHALDAASAMAFHFFLSLIPLLVVLGYVLGHLVRQKGVESFMAPLLDAAPDVATDLVRHELERLAGASASPIAPIGIVGFLWIASSGAHGLMNVFELSLSARRRPWWKKRLFALVWVLGSVIAVCFTAWTVLAIDTRVQRFDDEHETEVVAPSASAAPASAAPHAHKATTATKRPHLSRVKRRMNRLLEAPFEKWSLALVVLVLGVCGLAAFYRFAVEHPKGVERRAWPGAFVAMTAFLLVSWGFSAYVSSLSSYALFYGGLAAVAVLLFWLYLSSLALLVGAELNAQLEGVRDAPPKT